MDKEALIFIPDISGFTQFVNRTEIKHSNHIIKELLEIIISSNKLDMVVSEIEGDAILFYKEGEIPKLDILIDQVAKMFIDFHFHLKVIERDNVCQCGACKTAPNLTLKFISHYGKLQETTIHSFSKIVGSDVILAHRLLKNKLNTNEYLLLTEKLFANASAESNLPPWVKVEDHNEQVEDFDELNLKYLQLTPLLEMVPDPEKSRQVDFTEKPLGESIFINAPVMLVHEVLTDIESKYEWVPGIKKIDSQDSINRVNASHTCVFDDLEIHFITEMNKVKEGEVEFVESGELKNGIRFISDFKLKEKDKGTLLTVNVFPAKSFTDDKKGVKKVVNDIKTKLALFFSRNTRKKNLFHLKNYTEKLNKARGVK